MKKILLIFICLTSISFAQDKDNPFLPGWFWDEPYHFTPPDGFNTLLETAPDYDTLYDLEGKILLVPISFNEDKNEETYFVYNSDAVLFIGSEFRHTKLQKRADRFSFS